MAGKDAVRQAIWRRLREERAARFPFPVEGRIPNFRGAEQAAERLFAAACYREARVVKCNPDSPQLPVRRRALRDGKVVVMAVPRLRERACFLRLDPARIPPEALAKAASISGAARCGEPLAPEDVPPLHLVVAGSVAVRRDGARIGKGEGYSDLEFAILLELGRIGPRTPIVTTVHDLQVTGATWPVAAHDIPLDWIFTPDEAIACPGRHARPPGILWEHLPAEKRAAIPVLADWAQ